MRSPDVETHGGATLEEVTVPIIEISVAQEIIISMLDEKKSPAENPKITYSFRKPAVIRFYSNIPLDDVTVEIGETWYDAVNVDEQLYEVTIPREAHIKPDTYTASVYSSGNLVKAGILFTLVRESGTVNKMEI